MKWNDANAGMKVNVTVTRWQDGTPVIGPDGKPVIKQGLVIKRCHDAYTGKIPLILVSFEGETNDKSGFSGERIRSELIEPV